LAGGVIQSREVCSGSFERRANGFPRSRSYRRPLDAQNPDRGHLRPARLAGSPERGLRDKNRVCEQDEMSEERIEQRTQAVIEYFGLPYSATPVT
jgi:hypothetical protein